MIEFEKRKQPTTMEDAVISEMMKRFFRARAKKSYLPITSQEIELIDLLLNGEHEEADDDELDEELGEVSRDYYKED